MRLIVVVNGEKTANDRAREAKKLLEWGFHNFEERALFAEGETLGSAKVYGGANGSVPLKANVGEVKIMVPKAGGEHLTARIVYTRPGAGAGEGGHAGRRAQSVARRKRRAGNAAACRRQCRARVALPGAPSMP